jgi:hypothetical protein
MTTFILSQETMPQIEGKEPRVGRVILDWKAHGEILGTIDAEAITETYEAGGGLYARIVVSAWRVAREKVEEPMFYRIESEGWFHREAA